MSKLIKMKKNKRYRKMKLTPKIKQIASKAKSTVNSIGDVTSKNIMELIKSYEMEKKKNVELTNRLSDISDITSSYKRKSSTSSLLSSDFKFSKVNLPNVINSETPKIKTQIIFPKNVAKKDNLEKFVDYNDYSLF
jgi:hypothetical protein